MLRDGIPTVDASEGPKERPIVVSGTEMSRQPTTSAS